jgi:hypothetical protein
MQEIYTNGPIVAGFLVYSDFPTYRVSDIENCTFPRARAHAHARTRTRSRTRTRVHMHANAPVANKPARADPEGRNAMAVHVSALTHKPRVPCLLRRMH